MEDSQSPIDYFFFILVQIVQQKKIDKLNAGGTKKKKDITLLFMQIKK